VAIDSIDTFEGLVDFHVASVVAPNSQTTLPEFSEEVGFADGVNLA
jgi:hypothetical protein